MFAQIDYSLNGSIWKMLYGVTDAQLGSPAWLAADDDKDGQSNGSELAAGTNPFNPGSSIRITALAPNGGNIDITFPTVQGKQYVAQVSPSLTAPVWTPTGSSVIGTGLPLVIPVAQVAGSFYRVLVQDVDSDSDQLSNWAESVTGYDPLTANTNGSPTSDHTALVTAITTSNVVTVSATDYTATQSSDALIPPVDTGRIAVRRSGPLLFNAVTVPLQKSGTAVEGTDYDALPASVTFTAGEAEIILNLNPKANLTRSTNVTAILKALAGAGYSLGGYTSGSVVIFPAGNTTGTGLTGEYQNTSNSAYPSQQTIFAGAAEMTRTDATIDFSSGVNGWGAIGGPTGLSTPSTNYAFSVRWTGQILPKYSETYYIDFRSDESAKVWVNGVLLIDRWQTQAATDYINTIDLKAGVLYDIQIDYWNNLAAAVTTAEAKLYWYSASQVKQIIPQNRLFPAPALASKTTAVTSAVEAVGYVGTPLSYTVTSPIIGGSVTFALAANSGPLPPGLSLDGATGVISGTPSTAGTYNVAVNASNTAAGTTTGSSVINFVIYPVGGVTKEVLAATGNTVASIVIPGGTPANSTIPTIDDDTNFTANTGERLRGYFVPPKTGNYYFWIAANNEAELWISNDAESVNKVRRARIVGGSGKKVWNAQAIQQSPWLSFVAGQKYYFEVLNNPGSGAVDDDHVAVGWCQDDLGAAPSVVGGVNANGASVLIPNGGAALQGYPYSGTIGGYACQPYDYPITAAAAGTLYACNLGPQGASSTNASGSANIRVNAGGTQAVLKFDYSGLTSPKTNYHLHVDGYETHQNGEIIYDIDDVDAFRPDLRTADGGYIWDFTPGGTFPTAASLLDGLQRGKVYLNIHTVNYPAGEIRGNFTLVDGSQTPPNPAAYADPGAPDDHATDAGAARFLNQASFGASPTDIAYVKANGFDAWINDQLTKPTSYTANDVVAGLTADINTPYPSSLFVNTWWKYSITGPDQLRQRFAFALSEIMVVSYANDTGPLQRNGRILADHYDNLIDYGLPTAGLANSGNFKGLLKAVTLTPAMGLYLDMRANNKGDITIGRHPNENYAREIMQLFSVGLNRMWDDGKLILDSKGGLVPTYGQPEIIGLANLFTGWNYAQALQASGRLPANFAPGQNNLDPMMLVPLNHERASKLLLNRATLPAATGQTPRVSITTITTGTPCTVNTSTIHGLKVGDTVHIANVTGGTFTGAGINAGQQVTAIVSATAFKVGINCSVVPTAYTNAVVTGANVTAGTYTTSGIAVITGSQADNAGSTVPHPYDQYGLNELDKAIDNITGNDNVGPYICRQLIQRLVTSSPSPGYVYRVVQKFRDNGSGVRGDLSAVLKQILLDGEARNSAAAQDTATTFGKQFGKQREPLLRVAGPARSFPSVPYTGTYAQLTGLESNKLRIVTTTPNDFSSGFTVSLDFSGNYTPAGQSLIPFNVPTSTAYGSTTLAIASISTGSPCTVTTVSDHQLTTGDTISIAGVSGGTFTPTINGTYVINATGPNTFTVPVNCTVLPTSVASATINGVGVLTVSATGMVNVPYTQTAGSNILTVNTAGPPTNAVVLGNGSVIALSSIAVGTPSCVVTTAASHGLSTGQRVNIGGITTGAFTGTINTNFTVTVIDGTSFSIPVECTVAPTAGVGSMTKTVKSRVYLNFLTQTAAGGAGLPALQVYDVDSINGTTSFMVTTADTPVTARAGNVLIPKIAASYTVETSTLVRFNTNVNHNMQVTEHAWIDTPVQGGAPVDAEFVVSAITDEDHLKVAYPPFYPAPIGAYTPPSGQQNSVTIWPLVPPPLGRSGVIKVNQSTFSCGGTDGTITQTPLNAPTVFNYFFPDYRYPGTLSSAHLDSPEFQLSTDTNIVNLTNSLTNMIIGTGGGNSNLVGLSSYNNGGGAVVFDIGEFLTPAQTANGGISALIDAIANRLVGGPLTPGTKAQIQTLVTNTTYFPYQYVSGVPTNTHLTQFRDRARQIVQLILCSSEYAVQK